MTPATTTPPARRNTRPWLLFSVTPPRATSTDADIERIAARTRERLTDLDLDAVVLYDVHDETDRTDTERPFPYLPTLDPTDYHDRLTDGWDVPVVVYRSVGEHQPEALARWFATQDPQRVRRKQEAGVSFFVTQVVYDVGAAKSMVSDYHYACLDAGQRSMPVVFTLSVCGSRKTLEFLSWLGVSVPAWVRNDLRHTDDPLAISYEQCLTIADDLSDYCTRHGIDFGFNVESVTNRRAEIEASVRLARALQDRLSDTTP
jgi:hypothetical protein